MKIINLLCALVLAGPIAAGCVTTVTADGKPVVRAGTDGESGAAEVAGLLDRVKGEYLELNTRETERIVQEITDGNIDTIKKVMNDPNAYEPPVLFAYAAAVFDAGQYDTSMFWYYTAQLRARSDANKSKDESVQKGVTNLSLAYGQLIGRYALAHPDDLERTMRKVIEWDEMTERKYNPKWVAILGNEARISDTIRFCSPDEYGKIDREVRRGWRIGFEAAIKKIRDASMGFGGGAGR